MVKVLTEADYTTRKRDLAEAHRMAADAFKLASHKQATGNGTAEDVAVAKAHMDGVAGQQEALESAWLVQLEQNTEAAIAQRNEQWGVSRAIVDNGIAERQLAADAIVKALHVIEESYARYGKANDAIIEAVRSWAGSDFEKLAAFRSIVSGANNPDFERLHRDDEQFGKKVQQYNVHICDRADTFAPVEN